MLKSTTIKRNYRLLSTYFMELNMRMLLKTLATVSFLLSPAVVLAQTYPEKPIEMIVAFDPGGGTDVAARSIARYMEKYLGNNAKIVVINKPGAGGELGFTALANAKPDGYTIGFINAPGIIAYTIERETRYKMSDFTPIGNIVQDPNTWYVRTNSDITSVKDVIEFGKKTPGALTIGTSGSSGNSEHIAIMQIERNTGAKFNHAPFGATAPLRAATLGGHVPLGSGGISELVALAKDGKIRILGVMSEKRSPLAPDVPTFKEQGVEVLSVANRGLAAPKNIPADILAKLESALEKAINDPEYNENAKKASIPLEYLNSKDFAAHLNKLETGLRDLWNVTPWREKAK